MKFPYPIQRFECTIYLEDLTKVESTSNLVLVRDGVVTFCLLFSPSILFFFFYFGVNDVMLVH